MGRFVRVAVSVGLLAALAWILDARALADRLSNLRVSWALVALAVSVVLMVLSALRWRLTEARLGVHLPVRTALSEYYLAVLLNQVLPGAVMGDVSRAVRHGRSGVGLGPAGRAVLLERASGQAVMLAAAALSVLFLPLSGGARHNVARAATVAGAVLAMALAVVLTRRQSRAPGFTRDLHAALLARDVVGVQLLMSSLIVLCFVAMYVAAARAVGVDTPIRVLAPLVCPVLVSMLIPATIAGWGIREAAAAALWRAVGLMPEDGVAISAAYGVLALVSSLPGVLVLLSAARGRRAGRDPERSAGSAGAAPDRGSGPEAA
ncbi:MAG: flippase-like domain-containing protein [Gemmatimonadetes bacterium]|nr:flippase-like domain-containing protein [Gemmatimonadota bacterium]